MMQAYGQMLQYLQQAQQPQLQASYGAAAPQPPTVSVTVEGMRFQYQLTEDDLHKVFCRYGKVTDVSVDEVCSSALVTFASLQDASTAIKDLDGKVLNGLEGTLR